MRKILSLVAILAVAACSEPTSVPVSHDVAAARSTSPRTTPVPEATPRVFGGGSITLVPIEFDSTKKVASPADIGNILGGFDAVNIGDASAVRVVILGSWDGAGKQAQHGGFAGEMDAFFITCGDDISLGTTFSNQKSVAQHYPEPIGPKTNKYLSGADGDDMGFNQTWINNNPTYQAWIPLFESVGASQYDLTLPVSCPTGYVLSTTLDQPKTDEAWGVHSVTLR